MTFHDRAMVGAALLELAQARSKFAAIGRHFASEHGDDLAVSPLARPEMTLVVQVLRGIDHGVDHAQALLALIERRTEERS